jgi:hypothetical protein
MCFLYKKNTFVFFKRLYKSEMSLCGQTSALVTNHVFPIRIIGDRGFPTKSKTCVRKALHVGVPR